MNITRMPPPKVIKNYHFQDIFVVICHICCSFSYDITCNFKNGASDGPFGNYFCEVASDPKITSKDIVISNIHGGHQGTQKHADVIGFKVEGKTFNYFPTGIKKNLPNIEVFYVENSKLMEIQQKELKPFTKLTKLFLGENLIKELEKDLFKYNSKIEKIRLHNNRIQVVHPKVFSGLTLLSFVSLYDNKCISRIATDLTQVQKLSNELRTVCSKPEFVNDERNEKLSDEMKMLKNTIEEMSQNVSWTIQNANKIQVQINRIKDNYQSYFEFDDNDSDIQNALVNLTGLSGKSNFNFIVEKARTDTFFAISKKLF